MSTWSDDANLMTQSKVEDLKGELNRESLRTYHLRIENTDLHNQIGKLNSRVAALENDEDQVEGDFISQDQERMGNEASLESQVHALQEMVMARDTRIEGLKTSITGMTYIAKDLHSAGYGEKHAIELDRAKRHYWTSGLIIGASLTAIGIALVSLTFGAN